MIVDRPTFFGVVEGPIGPLTATSDGEALTGLYVTGHVTATPRPSDWLQKDELFDDLAGELERYRRGELREFSVPLAPRGTPFQQEVWRALQAIPYGTTTTYGSLATTLGRPSAARAVGAANGRNPISILIPCHRLIGASSSLTGYAGGVDKKRFLLELEGALP